MGAATVSIEPTYPDPQWSSTYLNYFKDADQPPPTVHNSSLSTHDLRVARRANESPNVAKTAVRVRNVRGRESTFNFAKHGFRIVTGFHSRIQDWANETELKEVYFPEVSDLLKRVTGAKDVFQYEHHVRTATLEDALAQDSLAGEVDINGPVRRVHIDESPASAKREFAYWVNPDGPDNEHLRNRHFAIYNVWKPLKTVRRDPLCLCDARTINDEDLQSGHVTVPTVGEIENFAIRAPKDEGKHEFVYLRGQQPDEALVFRIFDSRVDGGLPGSEKESHGKRSHGVAHSSFVDPGTERDPPRQSVEVRSFCVF